MGVWATRGGRAYRPGDEGFEEAWSANLRDIIDDWSRKLAVRHAECMATDPAYRARQEELDALLEQAFST